jgi:hypothetical protein
VKVHLLLTEATIIVDLQSLVRKIMGAKSPRKVIDIIREEEESLNE